MENILLYIIVILIFGLLFFIIILTNSKRCSSIIAWLYVVHLWVLWFPEQLSFWKSQKRILCEKNQLVSLIISPVSAQCSVSAAARVTTLSIGLSMIATGDEWFVSFWCSVQLGGCQDYFFFFKVILALNWGGKCNSCELIQFIATTWRAF